MFEVCRRRRIFFSYIPCRTTHIKFTTKHIQTATKPFEKIDFRSAEARRDAVRAISGLCSSGVVAEMTSCAQIVFDAIMNSFEDYETTDRGDVGSLVRSAAVDAVKSMVDSHLSTVDSERVVSVLLKQSCEKIDSIRSKAGQVLFELIHRSDFSLQSDSRKILGEAFPRDADIQFASVTDTFPRLQTLLCRYDSVISGMTLSCANRNAQSLVKAARAAFLGFAQSIDDDSKALLRVCDRILDDMKCHRGESRVSVPCLETIEMLLTSGCLQVCAPPCDLWQRICKGIQYECRGSKDIKKVMAAAKVLVSLLTFPSPARDEALRGILTYMCHRYPKVRSLSGEALYCALCANEDLLDDDDKFDNALEILSSTQWGDSVSIVRKSRNELYPLLLGIPAPENKNLDSKNNQDSDERKQQEYGYDALVKEMHY